MWLRSLARRHRNSHGSRRWIAPLAERCTMPDLTAKPTISIVVPFHNEEDTITELYARLHSVMEDVDWQYQFVFVDDGSTDLTTRTPRQRCSNSSDLCNMHLICTSRPRRNR